MKHLTIGLISLVFLTACGTTIPQQKQVTQTIETKKLETEVATSETENILEEKKHTLNTANSIAKWKGSTPVKSKEGTIAITSGNIEIIDDSLNGSFVLDMNTIDSSSKGLVDHLKNEDFFDVENFPSSQFVITSSEKKPNNIYSLTGDLTIKDVTNPLTLEMQFSNQGDILTAVSVTEFDRTLWNIQYSSGKFFDNLGDKLINDNIEMEFELVFN